MLAIIFLIGFAVLTCQVIYLRELAVVFYGNEIAFSAILTSWLLFGGLGGFLGAYFSSRLKQTRKWAGVCLMALSILLPAVLYCVRISRNLLQLPQGEIIGIAQIYTIAMASLFLPALILNFTFVLSVENLRRQNPSQNTPAKCYLTEALGSAVGGLLLSFVLLRTLNSFQILCMISGLILIGGSSLLAGKRRGILSGLVMLAVFALAAPILQKHSILTQWNQYQVLETANSPYGNLLVAKSKDQTSFFENGFLISSFPNLEETESAVHPALAIHPHPHRVLLIGDSSPVVTREILKHPVEDLAAIELDPKWIHLKKKYLTTAPTEVPAKVRIIPGDGRRFIKNARTPFDVVIIDLPEPSTLLINRYYTIDFFEEVKATLSKGGILALRLPGMANYPSKELVELIQSVKQSLEQVFAQTAILALQSTHLLATDETRALKTRPEDFLAPLAGRGVQTAFFNENYLPYNLTSDRQEQLITALNKNTAVLTNRDFRPAAQFYATLYWSAYASPAAKNVLRKMSTLPEFVWLLLPLAWLVIFLCLRLWIPSFKSIAALNAMGWTGFSQIALEMVMILAYQSIYGYVYLWVAVILAGFMLGLAIGSAWNLLSKRHTPLFGKLKRIQFWVIFYPLFLMGLFEFLKHTRMTFNLGTDFLFLGLAIVTGFFGGLQFPLIQKMIAEGKNGSARSMGIVYGIDLLGSCLGALAVGSLMISILGVIKVCLLLSLINLTSWLILKIAKDQPAKVL